MYFLWQEYLIIHHIVQTVVINLHTCLWQQNIRKNLCGSIAVRRAQEHNAFFCHPYDYWQKISPFLHKVKSFVLGHYAFVYLFIYLFIGTSINSVYAGKIPEDERITVLLECVKIWLWLSLIWCPEIFLGRVMNTMKNIRRDRQFTSRFWTFILPNTKHNSHSLDRHIRKFCHMDTRFTRRELWMRSTPTFAFNKYYLKIRGLEDLMCRWLFREGSI